MLLSVCTLSPLGFLKQGSWKLLDELDGLELKDLADKLPSTILHSHADNTVKKYLRTFRRWNTWVATHKLSSLPAKPHGLALYLQHLSEKIRSKAAD